MDGQRRHNNYDDNDNFNDGDNDGQRWNKRKEQNRRAAVAARRKKRLYVDGLMQSIEILRITNDQVKEQNKKLEALLLDVNHHIVIIDEKKEQQSQPKPSRYTEEVQDDNPKPMEKNQMNKIRHRSKRQRIVEEERPMPATTANQKRKIDTTQSKEIYVLRLDSKKGADNNDDDVVLSNACVGSSMQKMVEFQNAVNEIVKRCQHERQQKPQQLKPQKPEGISLPSSSSLTLLSEAASSSAPQRLPTEKPIVTTCDQHGVTPGSAKSTSHSSTTTTSLLMNKKEAREEDSFAAVSVLATATNPEHPLGSSSASNSKSKTSRIIATTSSLSEKKRRDVLSNIHVGSSMNEMVEFQYAVNEIVKQCKQKQQQQQQLLQQPINHEGINSPSLSSSLLSPQSSSACSGRLSTAMENPPGPVTSSSSSTSHVPMATSSILPTQHAVAAGSNPPDCGTATISSSKPSAVLSSSPKTTSSDTVIPIAVAAPIHLYPSKVLPPPQVTMPLLLSPPSVFLPPSMTSSFHSYAMMMLMNLQQQQQSQHHLHHLLGQQIPQPPNNMTMAPPYFVQQQQHLTKQC